MDVGIPETTPLSEVEIAEFEQALGGRLPEAYRRFVERYNGAVPEANLFKTPGNESSVRSFIPLSEIVAVRDSLGGILKSGIPVAEDDCGNLVWIHPKSGEVFFWDHEIASRGRKIAADFSSFLALLRKDDGIIEEPVVLSMWADPEFLALHKDK